MITIYYILHNYIGGVFLIKKISLTLFILLLFTISACSNSDATDEKNPDNLTIQTTLYPIQYIIEEIGGDAVSVETIYPPGVDAHTYEPTSKEVTEIAKADAFVYLGAGMEGFASKAASALQDQDVELIEIGVDKTLFNESTEHEADDGHEHSDLDPHIWLDPLRMNQMADSLLTELIKLDPEHKDIFEKNLTVFKEKMIGLNEDFDSTLKNKANKKILVTHAAYGYWELSYGLEQLPISGLSTSDEPSQKQLAEVTRLAKDLNINYVIYGQNDANQTAEIIQKHIDADKLIIHNLAVLTEDDLKNEADYLSLMKENLSALDKATN